MLHFYLTFGIALDQSYITRNMTDHKHTICFTIALKVGANFIGRTFPEARIPVLRGPRRVTGAVTALEPHTTGGTT